MRLWYFAIALGIVVVADGGDVERSINVAVLLPIADDCRPFSAARLRPAMNLAVTHVSAFLSRRLRVSYADSKCSSADGINESFKYFVRGPPHVFFGPVCDYAVAPVVRQSYFWNIPVVSVGAMAHEFLLERLAHYPLLTRTGPANTDAVADAVFGTMRVYGWRRLKLLYVREAGSEVNTDFCHLAAGAITKSASYRRLVTADYYKMEPEPAKINFEHVLINEVGHDFAGKYLTRRNS